jgi:transposase-like protein
MTAGVLDVREARLIVLRAVMVAAGVDTDGSRDVLGAA